MWPAGATIIKRNFQVPGYVQYRRPAHVRRRFIALMYQFEAKKKLKPSRRGRSGHTHTHTHGKWPEKRLTRFQIETQTNDINLKNESANFGQL